MKTITSWISAFFLAVIYSDSARATEATREFGPVIAAGLGGVDTEFLAKRMKPGLAVAKTAAMDTSAEEFLELFKGTAAYEILSGRARGHRRIVSDGELLRCFRAFLFLAQRFARHVSPLTTVVYTHPSDQEMRDRLRGRGVIVVFPFRTRNSRRDARESKRPDELSLFPTRETICMLAG